MTRITCTCPTCGTVAPEVDDLVVVADPRSGDGWYSFDCFGCARQAVTEIPGTVVEALDSIGIPVRRIPAEVTERDAMSLPAGPIGLDDLLDLLLWLQDHDDRAARS